MTTTFNKNIILNNVIDWLTNSLSKYPGISNDTKTTLITRNGASIESGLAAITSDDSVISSFNSNNLYTNNIVSSTDTVQEQLIQYIKYITKINIKTELKIFDTNLYYKIVTLNPKSKKN